MAFLPHTLFSDAPFLETYWQVWLGSEYMLNAFFLSIVDQIEYFVLEAKFR